MWKVVKVTIWPVEFVGKFQDLVRSFLVNFYVEHEIPFAKINKIGADLETIKEASPRVANALFEIGVNDGDVLTFRGQQKIT